MLKFFKIIDASFLNKSNYTQFLFYFIVVIFFVSQIPFLNADADKSIASGSRGAWTDEGMYTAPVRNFIRLGCNEFKLQNSIEKTPYTIVTPLYSLYLFPFFKIFGVGMLKARLITLVTCCLLLILIFKRSNFQFMGIIFILTVMMFFPIHQYSHLCLAEIYSSLLIVLGIVYHHNSKKESTYISILSFYLVLVAAILFKIQFIYTLVLPLLTCILNYFQHRNKESFRLLLFSSVCFVGIVLLMFLLWYIPFKDAWSLTGSSSSGSINIKAISFDLIYSNINSFFFKKQYLVFSILFVFAFLIYLFILPKSKAENESSNLMNTVLLWLLIESHKISLSYLPVRYLISFYMAMGLFSAIVFAQLFIRIKTSVVISTVIIIACFAMNVFIFFRGFESRSFVLLNLNNYFSGFVSKNDVAVGPWAPVVFWDAGCVAYPIWAVYTKNKSIIESYLPNYIVSEFNEADSDSAFSKNNIILSSRCDSLLQAEIALWKVNIYKLKQ